MTLDINLRNSWGIHHNFECGCHVLERGEGEFRLDTCEAHKDDVQAWPNSRRLPDYADLIVAEVMAKWAMDHVDHKK